MAKERPLQPAIVQAWHDAWQEKDLYSDAAIRHLQSLISDNHCMVVVTRGVGSKPRSLVFRCFRRAVFAPRATAPAAPDRDQLWPKGAHDPDLIEMFAGAAAPAAPIRGQLWRRVDTGPFFTGPALLLVCEGIRRERIFAWDGAQWVLCGYLSADPTIMMQGEQECSFTEALAFAHEHERWMPCEFIYTFDDSTWGNA